MMASSSETAGPLALGEGDDATFSQPVGLGWVNDRGFAPGRS